MDRQDRDDPQGRDDPHRGADEDVAAEHFTTAKTAVATFRGKRRGRADGRCPTSTAAGTTRTAVRQRGGPRQQRVPRDTRPYRNMPAEDIGDRRQSSSDKRDRAVGDAAGVRDAAQRKLQGEYDAAARGLRTAASTCGSALDGRRARRPCPPRSCQVPGRRRHGPGCARRGLRQGDAGRAPGADRRRVAGRPGGRLPGRRGARQVGQGQGQEGRGPHPGGDRLSRQRQGTRRSSRASWRPWARRPWRP